MGAEADKKTVTMPDKSFKDRIAKERERGMRSQAEALEKRAKDAGFASVDAMMEAAIAANKGGSNGQGRDDRREERSERQGGQQRQSQARDDGEVTRLRNELAAEKQKREAAEAKAAKAERDREDAETAAEIRSAAAKAGIIDPEFGEHLLRRKLTGMTAKEVRAFDEVKFFADLKTEKPHLFGVTTQAATTGTGSAGNDTTSTAGANNAAATAANDAGAAAVDVSQMDEKEWQAYKAQLAAQGISFN